MQKEKFHIEFIMGKVSLTSLWRMISQIDGLSEWFADNVTMDSTETIYTFSWGKSNADAEIINIKSPSLIRFQWLEEDEETYFEFQIHKEELSNEISLQITDFAEPDETQDAIILWEKQIDKMKRRLGIL